MTDTTDETATNTEGPIVKRAEDIRGEVVKMDPNDLRSLQNWDDAVAYATETYGEVVDASTEIGDGFALLDNKDALIDTPMMVLGWRFTDGDYGVMCVARVMLRNPIVVNGADTTKVVIIDGGTGICDQIMQYQERTGRTGGMLVSRGLRKSEYVNEHGAGVTHYLNV